MIFFTADTHFGHARIIGFCSRPFADIGQMDLSLIGNWNERVGPHDIVYHLGDFTLSDDPQQVWSWFEQLNGMFIYLLGLHQHHDGRWLTRYGQEENLPEFWNGTLCHCRTATGGRVHLLPPEHTIVHRSPGHEAIWIALSHYPMREWDRKHHGSLHLHGHSHGRSDIWPATMDVGVDTELADYGPISLATVLHSFDLSYFGADGGEE